MKTKEGIKLDIEYYRALGRDYCTTEGSSHYQAIRNKGGLDAVEYAIANGKVEDFAVVNVHKYIERFTETRNPDDLKKVADYAHILCGIELDKECDV